MKIERGRLYNLALSQCWQKCTLLSRLLGCWCQLRRRCKTVNIIRSSIIQQRGIFGGNAIFDILEPPAFKEYSIHWVLEALCICLCLCLCVFLCLCICLFVSLRLGHCHHHHHYLHPGAQRQGYRLKIEKKTPEKFKQSIFSLISNHFF